MEEFLQGREVNLALKVKRDCTVQSDSEPDFKTRWVWLGEEGGLVTHRVQCYDGLHWGKCTEGGTEKLTVEEEIRMSIVETKKQLGCYRWFRATGLEVWTWTVGSRVGSGVLKEQLREEGDLNQEAG